MKAQSVTEQGEPDGWSPGLGFLVDLGPEGQTQLVVSVPPEHLASLHQQLVGVLGTPLKVLYRQVVDRADPKPQGFPPRDFVGLDKPADLVLTSLQVHAPLIYGDARCELWVGGALGDEVVLDPDGLIFCRPDDPAFRDVLLGNGLVEEKDTETMADRDYVKHWFHGDNDGRELAFIEELRLTEIAFRG